MNLSLLDRPIAFQRSFVNITGSVTTALFLSQALYWTLRLEKTSPEREGWFFKSREEWTRETGLSRREQEGARKRLKDLGILQERQEADMRRTINYRLNQMRISELLEKAGGPGETPGLLDDEEGDENGGNSDYPSDASVQNVPMEGAETAPCDKMISEITAETTSAAADPGGDARPPSPRGEGGKSNSAEAPGLLLSGIEKSKPKKEEFHEDGWKIRLVTDRYAKRYAEDPAYRGQKPPWDNLRGAPKGSKGNNGKGGLRPYGALVNRIKQVARDRCGGNYELVAECLCRAFDSPDKFLHLNRGAPLVLLGDTVFDKLYAEVMAVRAESRVGAGTPGEDLYLREDF